MSEKRGIMVKSARILNQVLVTLRLTSIPDAC